MIQRHRKVPMIERRRRVPAVVRRLARENADLAAQLEAVRAELDDALCNLAIETARSTALTAHYRDGVPAWEQRT